MVAMIEKKINNYSLFIFKDAAQLSKKLSEFICSDIKSLLVNKKRCQICVCGGSSPKLVYDSLSNKILDWERVDVFLGDERCVDPSSSDSNSKMLKKSLLQNKASDAFFYEIFNTNNIDEKISKEMFLDKLKEKCNGDPPVFDLTLLGLGDDGHTASLFPNNKDNMSNDLIIYSYGKGLKRISLTPKILSSSSKIIFLVSGRSKNKALKRLLDEKESLNRTPAKLIKSNSQILIFCDEEASSELII